MRRPDKRGLRGHETAGEKGGTGMMGHLAVHQVGIGQPRGKGTRADCAGVPERMHLYSRAIGRLLGVRSGRIHMFSAPPFKLFCISPILVTF